MASDSPKITPSLMFAGQAEQAMEFYTSIFDRSAVGRVVRQTGEEGGTPGRILHATFTLAGQTFMCVDSIVAHEFTFTPAISLHVACGTEEEIDRYFGRLAEDGAVLMPLAQHPFSGKFGWVQDRFGVSWQLTLEPPG